MKEKYSCIECGFETPKWMGRCTKCGKWDTLKLVKEESSSKGSKRKENIVSISKVSSSNPKDDKPRIKSGFSELDRVLGGGFVNGQVLLVGGDPGIGKTTLLLQLLDRLQDQRQKVIYASGEESSEQLSVHATRLDLDNEISVISTGNIDSVLATVGKKKLNVLVVDSIHTFHTKDLNSVTGGVGQVKECTSRLVDYAKQKGVIVIIVGHITKGGDIAGPKTVEHLVDSVLYLEGDSASKIRLVRSVKNRFGSTREVGVFFLGKRGFEDSKNPTEAFILSQKKQAGVCKGLIFEGRRGLLVEIQTLVTDCIFSAPQRVVSGLKKVKAQMICAMLTKHTKANFLNKDVYINTANGISADDSSLDLAISVALLSSYFEVKIDPKKVAIGELSLTGEVHTGENIVEKVSLLQKLGYKKLLLPSKISKKYQSEKSIKFIDSLRELNMKGTS